jgi:hypothetical protein
MVIETATIWTFSAMLLMQIIIGVYFVIFFMIFYIMGWAVAQALKPIIKIMSHK